MELKYEHGKIAIENKVFTTLDRFVSYFTKLLEERVDYVIKRICCDSFWKGTWH